MSFLKFFVNKYLRRQKAKFLLYGFAHFKVWRNVGGRQEYSCLLSAFQSPKSKTKGQLISKCPFGIIVWTKMPTKLFLDFCPEIFWTFLGASWKLFGASCRLPCSWYYIESYKKIQGRNPEIISLAFLSKQ